MKVRTLPREEWVRLADPDTDALLRDLFPRDARVVAVEDDSGQIVARMAVLSIPHLESFWISREAFGNPGITRALLRACVDEARALGQRCLYANADNTMTASTLKRLGGVQVPMETYLVPLGAA